MAGCSRLRSISTSALTRSEGAGTLSLHTCLPPDATRIHKQHATHGQNGSTMVGQKPGKTWQNPLGFLFGCAMSHSVLITSSDIRMSCCVTFCVKSCLTSCPIMLFSGSNWLEDVHSLNQSIFVWQRQLALPANVLLAGQPTSTPVTLPLHAAGVELKAAVQPWIDPTAPTEN